MADSERIPSRAMAKRLHCTHQSIDLMEARFITMLRRAIWLEDYRACKFRFRAEFLSSLRELGARLDQEGIRAFSKKQWSRAFTYQNCKFALRPEELGQLSTAQTEEGAGVLLASRWEGLLRELWGVTRARTERLGTPTFANPLFSNGP